jgi:WD40 repeat protein
MASGDSDSKIIIWDLATFSIKYNFSGQKQSVLSIRRLSSNLMASVGDDFTSGQGAIKLWDWLTERDCFCFV